MAILEVTEIEKHFGNTRVLENVSFSLEEGNALAIIGSSGSGKTTLLRCLNFLETPDRGVITVRGEKLLMPPFLQRSGRETFAKNACILAWCFSPFTCFPSIRPWRT